MRIIYLIDFGYKAIGDACSSDNRYFPIEFVCMHVRFRSEPTDRFDAVAYLRFFRSGQFDPVGDISETAVDIRLVFFDEFSFRNGEEIRVRYVSDRCCYEKTRPIQVHRAVDRILPVVDVRCREEMADPEIAEVGIFCRQCGHESFLVVESALCERSVYRSGKVALIEINVKCRTVRNKPGKVFTRRSDFGILRIQLNRYQEVARVLAR